MAASYIYILGSHTGTLYRGVTSNLYLRAMRHKEDTLEGFTEAYGCKRLLYWEGLGGRKGPNSMGKISTLGVLRLRAIKR